MLSGNPVIESTVDAEALQKSLAGIPKSKFAETVHAVPSIDKAELRLLPIWKRTFPAVPSKIRIIVSGR
jgi:hypothetical protein